MQFLRLEKKNSINFDRPLRLNNEGFCQNNRMNVTPERRISTQIRVSPSRNIMKDNYDRQRSISPVRLKTEVFHKNIKPAFDSQ